MAISVFKRAWPRTDPGVGNGSREENASKKPKSSAGVAPGKPVSGASQIAFCSKHPVLRQRHAHWPGSAAPSIRLTPHTARSARCDSSRLQLDRLVAGDDGNPLKENGALRDLDERVAVARKDGQRSRIESAVSNPSLGRDYTVDTITYLAPARFRPALCLDHGRDKSRSNFTAAEWRRIVAEVPIAVIDRHPQSFRRACSPPPSHWRAVACLRIRRPASGSA